MDYPVPIMNYLGLAFVLVFMVGIIAILVSNVLLQKSRSTHRPSGFSDLELHLGSVLRSNDWLLTMRIKLAETQNYIQFETAPQGVGMQFPLVTETQKPRKESIVEACAAHGLQPDGVDSNVLDFHLTGSASQVAALVSDLLQRVFGAKPSDHLECEYGVPNPSFG